MIQWIVVTVAFCYRTLQMNSVPSLSACFVQTFRFSQGWVDDLCLESAITPHNVYTTSWCYRALSCNWRSWAPSWPAMMGRDRFQASYCIYTCSPASHVKFYRFGSVWSMLLVLLFNSNVILEWPSARTTRNWFATIITCAGPSVRRLLSNFWRFCRDKMCRNVWQIQQLAILQFVNACITLEKCVSLHSVWHLKFGVGLCFCWYVSSCGFTNHHVQSISVWYHHSISLETSSRVSVDTLLPRAGSWGSKRSVRTVPLYLLDHKHSFAILGSEGPTLVRSSESF